MNKAKVREIIKFTFGYILPYIFRIFGHSTFQVGIKNFRKNFKNADTLFILAPGSSVLKIKESEFRFIKKNFDSMAINFFSLHPFEASFYLIEPHKNELNYFQTCSNISFRERIFFKGHSTPKSLKFLISNARSAKELNYKINFLKESGTNSILPSENVSSLFSDSFSLGGSSLLYSLSLGFLVGYKQVVLCGFDMDEKYFFCNAKAPLSCQKMARSRGLCEVVHNFTTNRELQSSLLKNLSLFLDEVEAMNSSFRVFAFKSKGPLTEILDEFDLDVAVNF